MSQPVERKPSYSIIVPVYNNAQSLSSLLESLVEIDKKVSEEYSADVTFIFVIDGSPDESAQVLEAILSRNIIKAKILYHSRNFGSFAAIRTGLGAQETDYYGMIAADLQEPPELLISFFNKMHVEGSEVVVATRSARDDPFMSKLFSNAFWKIYKKFVVKNIPAGGVDLFGCSLKVRNELLLLKEANSSLVAQLFWLGHEFATIDYSRQKREHGKSGWSFSKKLKYMMDSVFSFTDLPIKFISFTGALAMFVALVYGIILIVTRLLGYIPPTGFAALMIVILFMGGLNAFAIGVLGNYAWRTFENSKARPLSLISSEKTFRKK